MGTAIGDILPVAVLVSPDRTGRLLDDLEVWLVQNNAVVMGVLLLVLGVARIGKGIGGLTT
jgi:hypothetical protein